MTDNQQTPWDFLPPLARDYVLENKVEVDANLIIKDDTQNDYSFAPGNQARTPVNNAIEQLIEKELRTVPGIGEKKAGQISGSRAFLIYQAGASIRAWAEFACSLMNDPARTQNLTNKRSVTSLKNGTAVKAFTKADLRNIKLWIMSWPYYEAEAFKSIALKVNLHPQTYVSLLEQAVLYSKVLSASGRSKSSTLSDSE